MSQTRSLRNHREQRQRRIYLTGFMGSGKTTIGPILANTIGYDFIDMDREIERQAGKSVPRIFQEDGEDHFRRLEQNLLSRLQQRSRLVVSLGGGTIADTDTLLSLKDSGILVYLKAAPDQIFRRLHHKDDRPTLKNPSGERLEKDELRTRINDLYRKREPLYTRADIVIRTDERNVGKTVDQIVKLLKPYLQ